MRGSPSRSPRTSSESSARPAARRGQGCHADTDERRVRLRQRFRHEHGDHFRRNAGGLLSLRTVPPDAIQSASVANFIDKKLKYRRVYIIDDQEAYSTGLGDAVQAKLRAAGVTVTRDGVSQQQSDFSALIAKIPRAGRSSTSVAAPAERQGVRGAERWQGRGPST